MGTKVETPSNVLTEPFEVPQRIRMHGHAAVFEKSISAMPPRIKQALAMLLDGYDYAQDLGCELWEFAVEAEYLAPFGLTASDWRWLSQKGLVDHAYELTGPGEAKRTFRHGGVVRLRKRTCFVLTKAGEECARRMAAGAGVLLKTTAAPSVVVESNGAPAHGIAPKLPIWDRDRQQLRIGRIIVKEFKVPAPNQEAILAAFQEENWAPRIDDPLPPLPDIEPKRRLHDTISSLNRNQKQSLIRFLGDGSGQGARWEFTRLEQGADRG